MTVRRSSEFTELAHIISIYERSKKNKNKNNLLFVSASNEGQSSRDSPLLREHNSVGTDTAYSNRTGVHTHTKVVHTNSIHGSGHKQYTYYSSTH